MIGKAVRRTIVPKAKYFMLEATVLLTSLLLLLIVLLLMLLLL